ncbi:MAG: DnaJ domain-containing protein [Desulfuromonas sp.]|nr:DnaJ domain-containing protein [Desulfuromonas sp.]
MSSFAESELLEACRVLFGSELQLNRDFLYYMQPGGIKSAYRQRAKETHPDRLIDAQPHEYVRQTELFRDVSQAYQLLDSFSADPHKRLWASADRSTHFDSNRTASPSSPASDATGPTDRQDSAYLLPKRHLETGLYLYYRGLISYPEMIEALVWQRRQRPIIGMLAERWGWLSAEDVRLINRYHGRRGRFGARAVELGYLTSFQVQVLLRYQRQAQKQFGQYFVEQGMMTDAEIEVYIRQQRQHNTRFSAPPR